MPFGTAPVISNVIGRQNRRLLANPLRNSSFFGVYLDFMLTGHMARRIMPYGTTNNAIWHEAIGGVAMEDVKELTKFMGGRSVVGTPKSDFEFIEIIRTGLPAKVIGCVVKSSAISEEVIYTSLRIARRTVARRKAAATRLKPAESELIYRFSKVLVTATEVLGSMEKAREWLLTENHAVCGNRPIDLLDTAIGFEDVMDVLYRIEYGVYS